GRSKKAFRARQALALQHLDQGRAVQPEQAGGLLLVPARPLEGLVEEGVLDPREGRAKVESCRGERAKKRRGVFAPEHGAGQVRGQDFGSSADDEGVLHGGPKLVHVSRPRVCDQEALCFGAEGLGGGARALEQESSSEREDVRASLGEPRKLA